MHGNSVETAHNHSNTVYSQLSPPPDASPQSVSVSAISYASSSRDNFYECSPIPFIPSPPLSQAERAEKNARLLAVPGEQGIVNVMVTPSDGIGMEDDIRESGNLKGSSKFDNSKFDTSQYLSLTSLKEHRDSLAHEDTKLSQSVIFNATEETHRYTMLNERGWHPVAVNALAFLLLACIHTAAVSTTTGCIFIGSCIASLALIFFMRRSENNGLLHLLLHSSLLINILAYTTVSLLTGQGESTLIWFLIMSATPAVFPMSGVSFAIWNGLALFATACVFATEQPWLFGKITPLATTASSGFPLLLHQVVFLIFALSIAVVSMQTAQVLNSNLQTQTWIAEGQKNKFKSAHAVAIRAAEKENNLLATMSHEIRTPLNGVIGMAQLLHRTELSDEQADYVDAITVSGRHLLSVINDIWTYSKIYSGQLVLEQRIFDLHLCIEEAVDLSYHTATMEERLDVSYIVEKNVPQFVIGDVVRVRQILTNLLSNAFKFTEQGDVVVEVKVASIKDDSANTFLAMQGYYTPKPMEVFELEVSVTDNGIGIPEEKQHKLFKPFSQVDSSISRQYEGIGLGLAMSHDLCNMMGGCMRVQSLYGKGSTFTFTMSTWSPRPQDTYEYESSVSVSDATPDRVRYYSPHLMKLVNTPKAKVGPYEFDTTTPPRGDHRRGVHSAEVYRSVPTSVMEEGSRSVASTPSVITEETGTYATLPSPVHNKHGSASNLSGSAKDRRVAFDDNYIPSKRIEPQRSPKRPFANRVLVVHTGAKMREAISKRLSMWGLDVVAVSSTNKALDFISRGWYIYTYMFFFFFSFHFFFFFFFFFFLHFFIFLPLHSSISLPFNVRYSTVFTYSPLYPSTYTNPLSLSPTKQTLKGSILPSLI